MDVPHSAGSQWPDTVHKTEVHSCKVQYHPQCVPCLLQINSETIQLLSHRETDRCLAGCIKLLHTRERNLMEDRMDVRSWLWLEQYLWEGILSILVKHKLSPHTALLILLNNFTKLASTFKSDYQIIWVIRNHYLITLQFKGNWIQTKWNIYPKVLLSLVPWKTYQFFAIICWRTPSYPLDTTASVERLCLLINKL